MKKTFFLMMLLLASQLIFAQKIQIESNAPVPIPGSGCLPIISPAGDYILLTGGDLKGLQKYDLVTRQLSTITEDKGAGFGAKISHDGSMVIFRNTEYKNKLRYTSLKSANVNTGEQAVIIKSTRNLQGVNIADGTVFAVDNGIVVKKKVAGKTVAAKDTPPVASIKEGQLYVASGNTVKLVSPAGTDASYLWASISPDGKKLLYYVIDTANSYVSDIDGSNPVALGVLRAPCWLGNNWVVGMLDADNGEIVTSSKIIAVAANGKGRTVLTDPSIIAMNPSASADATKIVYNTADGRIFLMNVKISN